MQKQTAIVRVNATDFLEVRPLKGFVKKEKNLYPIYLCFNSVFEWRKGHVLCIDYFLSDELDSVCIALIVLWSELISTNKYFIGGQVAEIEEKKKSKFVTHYVNRGFKQGGLK